MESKEEVVMIRNMEEADAPDIARIWFDGLEQTVQSVKDPDKVEEARRNLRDYGEKACSESGDIGPKGSYLFARWGGERMAMFVAQYHGRVVGSVAVQMGMDFGKPSEESKVASIWRMTVCSSVRRKGVGMKLMQETEKWVHTHGGTEIRLYTANVAAAAFYIKNGFKEIPYKVEHHLDPPIKLYKKDLHN